MRFFPMELRMKRCSLVLMVGMLAALLSHAMEIDANRARFEELFSNHSERTPNANRVHAINSLNDVIHAWHEVTPSQDRGPFYPRPLPRERDTDLTIKDNGPQALGVKVQVQGQVMDQNGTLIPGAKVEIWQACAAGSYNHPGDPVRESAPRDLRFQDYGVDTTGDDGQYAFKTIVPGAYPAGANWIRPPHIHYQVSAPGFKTLVTQLYFDGNSFSGPVSMLDGEVIDGARIIELNQVDAVLNQVPEALRPRLVVSFSEQNGIKLGVFNIYLKRQR